MMAATSVGTIAYPHLPTSSGVAFPGSAAPATLGSSFGPDDRPHRGGMLQSASRKVKAEDAHQPPQQHQQQRQGSRDGTTATAGSPSAASDASSGSDPESYDQWLGNVRTIESLREYIKTRLTRQEYDGSRNVPSHERGFNGDRNLPEPPTSARLPPPKKHEAPPAPLYPTLRLSE